MYPGDHGFVRAIKAFGFPSWSLVGFVDNIGVGIDRWGLGGTMGMGGWTDGVERGNTDSRDR